MYSTIDVRELRTRLRGRIVMAGEAGWDRERAQWNVPLDERPLALALPETPQDVTQLLDFANTFGLAYVEDMAATAFDGALVVSTSRIARAA